MVGSDEQRNGSCDVIIRMCKWDIVKQRKKNPFQIILFAEYVQWVLSKGECKKNSDTNTHGESKWVKRCVRFGFFFFFVAVDIINLLKEIKIDIHFVRLVRLHSFPYYFVIIHLSAKYLKNANGFVCVLCVYFAPLFVCLYTSFRFFFFAFLLLLLSVFF